ncbi:MAG: EAL domain-containing protein [Methylotetracoccus sp.]
MSSLRYWLPLIILTFTVLVAWYTAHRDRLAAEAIVRGQAVERMIQRMGDLQGLFERAVRRGEALDLTQQLALEGEHTRAALADDAEFVVSANRPGWVGQSLGDLDADTFDRSLDEPFRDVIERVRAERQGEVIVSASGRYVMGVYPVTLDGDGLTAGIARIGVLIAQEDLSNGLLQAHDAVERKSQEMIVLLAGFAALFGIVIHFLVTRRLGEVAAAAQRFAGGELDARSNVRGGDEVGRVAQVFNAMAQRVADTHRALEQRVEERTRELAQKLADLGREVVERRRAEDALRDEKEKVRVTLASLGDAVITTDLAGRVEYVNDAAEKLTGWSADRAIGEYIGEVFSIFDELEGGPVGNPALQCISEQHVVASGTQTILMRYDRREISIEHSAAPIRDHDGVVIGAVLVFRDVTEARRVARQLSHQASHDALTGLVNRREFEQRLLRILSASDDRQAHSLLYLDLDQFKVVNDTCGHAAGDELLRQISGVLAPLVRKRDTLARLGGDEFGVLLEACPQQRALRIAQKLRRALHDFRFVWDDRSFSIGASVGLVPIDTGTDSLASIFRAADIACYAAKDQGRNRVHVYQHDDRELAARHGEMQWVPRIQQAVADDRFLLYYQPIVALGGDAQPHGEILLRLREREGGELVMPSAFIPAAERYNQMQTIDRWVIRSVFAALRASPRQPRSSFVSINLSGQSLSDGHFLDFVESQIDLGGVELEQICFEVTETAAISNLSHATRFFSALKARGCRFALDDFGSGLSSFAYLKTLPVDFLKIDGNFVRDMERDPIDHAMVEAIHRIGHVMGIETIAECVESESAVERLRAIGVNYVQGYALGRPRPFDWSAQRAEAAGVARAHAH